MKTIVPPIKCQGIKSKLVPWIRGVVQGIPHEKWVEPFLGSGVVGFNMRPRRALFCDTNPHIIEFYKAVQSGKITPATARVFLEQQGRELARQGADFYYHVRHRFNGHGDPLDFLFLNRSCFNGVVRFNSKGRFNVPFGKKPGRFSPAYITKICNQIDRVSRLMTSLSWELRCQDYATTIAGAGTTDLVYCDPPYTGRHVDYFNSWSEGDEKELLHALSEVPSSFILSTWHSNAFRKNDLLPELWGNFEILTRDHFYHVGARERNRNAMTEALVLRTKLRNSRAVDVRGTECTQLALLPAGDED